MSAPRQRAAIIMPIAAIALASLAFSGCATTSEEPKPDASGTSATGVDPRAPEVADPIVLLWRQTASVPFFIAESEGLTTEFGLKPRSDYVENSPAAVAGIAGGTGDIGSASLWAVFSAIQEGIELKIIGEQFRHVSDSMFLETLPGSGIEGPEDLVGKKVGVVGLNAGHDLSIKNWFEENDLDWTTVEFVNLGYGEMGQALETGAIDAGTFTGGALVQARDAIGTVPVFDYTEILDHFPATSYIVRADWAAENPNTVAAFQCAVVIGGATLAADDDELYRAALKTGLEWDDAAIDGVTKVDYVALNDPAAQQVVPDLLFKNGLVEEEIDINDYLIPLPTNC